MGKRANPTLIEQHEEGSQVRSAKRRQVLPAVVSSQNAAIALLSIRDSVEFIVPEVVHSSKLSKRKIPNIKDHHNAIDGEFFPVTDDENDDGRHSPFPQEIKSCGTSTCHLQPPPMTWALRQPAFALGGLKTQHHILTGMTTTTKLPLGIPLPPRPSLAPHLSVKVKPINLLVLSSSK